MAVPIGILPPRLAGRAAAVLTRAFDQDPILTYYLGHGPRRHLASRMFFADIIESSLPFGHIYAGTTPDRLLGVAVWKPPDPPADSFRIGARSAVRQLMVRALYPRAARELFDGFAELEPLHPPVPHWYLMFVGVNPGGQGQGLGSRLLTPVLELADATGTLSYLETPFPRTHPFYQRLGFEIASEGHPFPGAPPLWTMIRKPRIGTKASRT
jgi:GNAT superfamily N-acetyltransferase